MKCIFGIVFILFHFTTNFNGVDGAKGGLKPDEQAKLLKALNADRAAFAKKYNIRGMDHALKYDGTYYEDLLVNATCEQFRDPNAGRSYYIPVALQLNDVAQSMPLVEKYNHVGFFLPDVHQVACLSTFHCSMEVDGKIAEFRGLCIVDATYMATDYSISDIDKKVDEGADYIHPSKYGDLLGIKRIEAPTPTPDPVNTTDSMNTTITNASVSSSGRIISFILFSLFLVCHV